MSFGEMTVGDICLSEVSGYVGVVSKSFSTSKEFLNLNDFLKNELLLKFF